MYHLFNMLYALFLHIYLCAQLLTSFSIRSNAVFKQQTYMYVLEIHVPFEHGFWLKFVDLIGQCGVTSVCSVETNDRR